MSNLGDCLVEMGHLGLNFLYYVYVMYVTVLQLGNLRQNYFNGSDYSSQVSTCMNTINIYGILKIRKGSIAKMYH